MTSEAAAKRLVAQRQGIELPQFLLDGSERWEVGRAWPSKTRGLTLELTHADSEDVRAASRSRDGHDDGGFFLHRLGADPAMTGLADAEGSVLVHRWMRRAVVRSTDAERYTKFFAGRRAEQAGRLGRSFAELGARAGFLCPDVVEISQDWVVMRAIYGETFARSGAEPDLDLDAWRDLWGAWSEAWVRLIEGTDTDAHAALPLHKADAEVIVLREWVSSVLRHDALPGLEAALSAQCTSVTGALRSGTGHRLTVAHRDLHDKQLLVVSGERRIGLLDFDTAAVAEPALDLANVLVHLDWRCRQGSLTENRARLARAIVLQTAERIGVPDERLDAYARSTALRLACVYAFRPRWAPLARQWLIDRLDAPAALSSVPDCIRRTGACRS